MTRQAFIQAVKQVIQQIDPQAEVWLFGSQARGDARPDSDWDFLMLTDMPVDRRFKYAVWDRLNDLELDAERVISTRIHNKTQWHQLAVTDLYQTVQQEGKRL
ncbi:DNA polymerase beta domain protein region [Fibrella aestuarina BUZ 2]|uniref:DNA polymerase beta domain protein region n=1 Tax=Fibrella aestuarina BUZ 2 TaxID=1166018 RepID=I0K4Y7_9BACT|nr:nucleotidyltransferase domain-containing protein [Fibrella aestuarina]CCG99190.1 DNA polymerase beta domain protein region [Fibrella aestuarina BUZ 2]